MRIVSTRCSVSPTCRSHLGTAVEVPVSAIVEPMAWVWGCAGRGNRRCKTEVGTQPQDEILEWGGGLVGECLV